MKVNRGIVIVFFLVATGLLLFHIHQHQANQFEDSIPESHTVAGRIVNISYPYIVVSGADNLERTIVVQTDTVVRQFENDVKGEDLKIGDYIDVTGEPNIKGAIQARFIQLLPVPAAAEN